MNSVHGKGMLSLRILSASPIPADILCALQRNSVNKVNAKELIELVARVPHLLIIDSRIVSDHAAILSKLIS